MNICQTWLLFCFHVVLHAEATLTLNSADWYNQGDGRGTEVLGFCSCDVHHHHGSRVIMMMTVATLNGRRATLKMKWFVTDLCEEWPSSNLVNPVGCHLTGLQWRQHRPSWQAFRCWRPQQACPWLTWASVSWRQPSKVRLTQFVDWCPMELLLLQIGWV